MKISVTQSDITEGERGDCYRCPVAPRASHTIVVASPDEVAQFVDDFDNGNNVAPFDFEVSL